jgi:hypothetical protein
MLRIHNFCNCICHLWSCWSSTPLQPWSPVSYIWCFCVTFFTNLLLFLQILSSPLVFPHWYLCTHPLLPPGSSLSFVHMAIHQHPSSLWEFSIISLILGNGCSSWVLWGFIFNYVIRRFRFKWWMKYNYILAVALNAGTAIAAIVIFFTLTLPKRGGIELNWWGNMYVSFKPCIWTLYLTLPPIACGGTQQIIMARHSSLYLNQVSLGPRNGPNPPRVIWPMTLMHTPTIYLDPLNFFVMPRRPLPYLR